MTNHTTSRRAFLGGTIAAAVAIALPKGVQANPMVLRTDADFLNAEKKVLDLMAATERNADGDRHVDTIDLWNAVDRSILESEPRTAIQAAVKLRRLLCRTNGMAAMASYQPHYTAIHQTSTVLTKL